VGGTVDPAQQVQQGGFAAAAGAEDDDEFSGEYVQVGIPQGDDFLAAALVNLIYSGCLNQGGGRQGFLGLILH
jgi:hypothetical protein